MKTPKSFRTGAFSKRRGKLLTILIHRGIMSNKSKVGYIKLYRTSEENELYFAEPFTKWHAWQDLILLTSHKDTFFFARGVEIQVKKGQIGWSVKSLAKRWCWSYTKVNSFLEFLKKRGQIEYQKNNVTTVITLINWDKYQCDEKAEVNQKETKSKPEVNQKETYNNVKNVKNNKESIDARSQAFHSEVAKFVSTYPKTLLREFYDYWTEKNSNGIKMRFEMEKTFEVSKRLATWAKRESGFKVPTKQPSHTNYALGN